MVGVDLGTRIVKVDVSKIRKGMSPMEEVHVPLDTAAMQATPNADSTAGAKSISDVTFDVV